MPDRITLAPGEVQYIEAPAGETLSMYRNKAKTRIKVKASSDAPVPVPGIPLNAWRAEYFDNVDLSGNPVQVEEVADDGGAWSTDGPGEVGPTQFSARWTGRFVFLAKEYEFTVQVDDGIRLYVDDELLIDQWKQQPPTQYIKRKTLTAGEHTVTSEYYNGIGTGVLATAWKVVTVIEPGPDPTPGPGPLPLPPIPDGFTTIQAAVNAAAPGAAVGVPPGVYREQVTIGTNKNGLKLIFAAGAKIDGQGQRQYGIYIDRAFGVVVQGGEVYGHVPRYQHGAVEANHATDLVLYGIDSHDNPASQMGGQGDPWGGGFGISGGDRVLIEKCVARHNPVCGIHLQGYGQGGLKSATVRDCDIVDNNQFRQLVNWHSGGLKASATTDMLLEGNRVWDNDGDGLWGDIDVVGARYVGNRLWGNTESGIHHEISYAAKIHGNVLWANGNTRAQQTGWAWGGAITISGVKDTEVYDNIVAWSSRSFSFISQERWRPHHGNSFHDNVVISQSGTWMSNWVDDQGGGSLQASANNRGANNRYWAGTPEPRGDRFVWGGGIQTLAAFNGTPGEEGGTYLTDAQKVAILTENDIPLAP